MSAAHLLILLVVPLGKKTFAILFLKSGSSVYNGLQDCVEVGGGLCLD